MLNDKEKLVDTLENIGIYEVTMNAELIAETLIANGVTVREKGEYIYHVDELGMTAECSCCHVEGMLYGSFCPNCGADMRGEEHG